MDRLNFTKVLILLFSANVILNCDGAKILCVCSTPSISHQVVFRALTQELAKRGHEVTFITTDPEFKDSPRENLKEIDMHDVSYEFFVKEFVTVSYKFNDIAFFTEVLYKSLDNVFEMQMGLPEVQKVLNSSRDAFDLLIVEAITRPSLGLTHKFDAPTIVVSTFYPLIENCETMGIPTHFSLFPNVVFRTRWNNLSMMETLYQMYLDYTARSIVRKAETNANRIMRKVFGDDCPDVNALGDNIDMLFLNINPIWEGNRAVPPSVIYLGGIHVKPTKEIPSDLKKYLDESERGVIYMSLGTNVKPSELPQKNQEIFMKVFSELPYDVLLKWDTEPAVKVPKNVRVSKWFPQNEVIRHPNVKLFITQAGMQSTDEAINAGVPLVALPVLGDQFFNAENYEKHGIGVGLDFTTLTEEKFKAAIEKVLSDKSYRDNVKKLGAVIQDQPEKPMERAMWWTEYVLRNKGAKHLRSPAANISWADYLMVDVLAAIFTIGIVFATLLYLIVKKCIKFFSLSESKTKIE